MSVEHNSRENQSGEKLDRYRSSKNLDEQVNFLKTHVWASQLFTFWGTKRWNVCGPPGH
jgi:hypothetical protein